MKLDRLLEKIGFGRSDEAFELLETEKGAPPFFAKEESAEPNKKERGAALISKSVYENERILKRELRADINPDIIFRPFMLCGAVRALVVYMNGMADADQVSDFIVRDGIKSSTRDMPEDNLAKFAIEYVFSMGESSEETDRDKAKKSVLDGLSVVFIEGSDTAIVMDTRGYEHRSGETAQSEKVVRGPQESFVENIRSNITLLRRAIRTDDLVAELRPCGADNGLKIAIVYREGVANAALLEEIKHRIGIINTRMITSSGALEQLTENSSLSPFPQVLATERPDRTAAMLMEGHVAVLLDGSPFANIMPATLFTLMSSSEDYSLRRPQGSIIRVVRFTGAIISVLLPAYFLALALHHQGLLSTEVLTTVVASHKMVFEPMGVEMIFLLLVFQLVREAGMRVPGNIGQAIGIIGGLILGQAAVSANLASSVLLIIVALTGLGNFCIPDYSTQLSASLIRIALVIASWMAGLLGMFSLAIIMLAFMAAMKSFGMPFLAPYAPKAFSKRPIVLRGKLTMHQRADDAMNTREGE